VTAVPVTGMTQTTRCVVNPAAAGAGMIVVADEVAYVRAVVRAAA
jgi:hypothetical protein